MYLMNGKILTIINNNIVNANGTKCIITKFPNYYDIMYNNRNVLHYNDLWKSKKYLG
jgi:hypothetical protein